jgi:hypothetical protein
MDRPLVGAAIGARPSGPAASNRAHSTDRRRHTIPPVGTGASDDDGVDSSSASGLGVVHATRVGFSHAARGNPSRGACHDRSGPDFPQPARVAAVDPAGSEPAG